MIGIPLAVASFAYGEWAAHKYLLHWLGRDKSSVFAFHFPTQMGEAIGLTIIGLAHAPLLPVAPFYTLTTWYLLAKYRRDHRRAHIDPEWGRTHLTWHYDHHMGPSQHKNWGVTFQWFDKLAGTRVAYVGSEKELADRKRNAERAAAAMEGRAPKPPKRLRWRDVINEVKRRRRAA
jgi:sterol desaturase/sphingolipid hydroxylase (fatty acid hydroxylase superfamily)